MFDGCLEFGADDEEDATGCSGPSAGSPAETVLPRFDMGGGEGDCGRSRIALVDSLRLAIFLSEGGGGNIRSSSSGDVPDDLGIWTGCGLNEATTWSVFDV